MERWLRRLAVVSFSVSSAAMGQSVIAPLPTAPGQPIGATPANAADAGITTGAAGGTETVPQGLAATVPGVSAIEEFLTWGTVHANTHVSYQFLYGTGIQSSPGQPADTITQTVSPGVTVALGPHWVLDYEPSLRFYSDKDFHNTLDHSLSLSGGTTYGNWSFGLSQNYTRTDDPLVQTASQTGVQSCSAALNAAYSFNTKLSLEMDAGVALSFVDGGQVITNALSSTNAPLSDSQSYFGSEWLNYQLDPKVAVAVGLSGGYTSQNGGLDTADEQYLGRVVLRPGPKLTLSADGGVEDRQYLNSDQPDTWTPIFAAAVNYNLFEPTVLSLTAGRSVQPALFQSQIVENTTVGLGIQQKLLGRLQLTLGYTYISSDYIGSKVAGAQRSDQGNSYQAGLSMGFLKHGTVGTFYQYSQNSSNGKGFGYSSNQTGFTLTWAY